MIRLMVAYPNVPGKRFDHKYYAEKHIPMVAEKLRPFGLVRAEVDTGLAGAMPGAPAPFLVVALVVFQSLDGFQSGMAAHGAAIMADIPNYTDIQPQVQISEIASV